MKRIDIGYDEDLNRFQWVSGYDDDKMLEIDISDNDNHVRIHIHDRNDKCSFSNRIIFSNSSSSIIHVGAFHDSEFPLPEHIAKEVEQLKIAFMRGVL